MARGVKKITTWKLKDATGLVVPVAVYLVENAQGMDRDQFQVNLEEPPERFADADIRVLKQKVTEAMSKRTTQTYEPYIEVTTHSAPNELIERSYHYVDDVPLIVRYIGLGTATDGEKIHVSKGRESGSADSGWPWTGVLENRTTALIPDTPENRQALGVLNAEVAKLAADIRAACHPKRIEATLEAIKAGLPWREADKAPVKASKKAK